MHTSSTPARAAPSTRRARRCSGGGRIAGAALDVFDGHPLPQRSPLMSAPNLLLTPHIGGATAETVERHSRIMVGEVERLIDGRPLRFCVNPMYVDYR